MNLLILHSRRLRAWWHGDHLTALRFYGAYLRWPLLLILAVLAGEKLIYYGILPLSGFLRRELAYRTAVRAYTVGREQTALVAIHRALLETRDDARLWVLAAKISDRLDSPDAAYCWREADGLEPGSVETQLAWAEAALRHNQLDQAELALRETALADAENPRYLLDAGELARAAGQGATARLLFQQLEWSNSRDPRTRLELAKWHADSSDPGELARARQLLLALEPTCRDRAVILRELVNVDLKQRDILHAQADMKTLLAQPDAIMNDRVRSLDVAQATGTLDVTLRTLLRPRDRAQASCVLEWMAGHGRAREALIWIGEQDETWQEDAAIGTARAACLAALGDWEHLRDDQRDSVWPGHEPMRLMLLTEAALSLREGNDSIAAWQGAVSACRSRGDLMEMLKFADRLRPADDGEEERAAVWAALVTCCPGDSWPLRLLLAYQLGRGDLVQAQALNGRLAELEPDDPAVKANYDLICLLRGCEMESAALDLKRLEAAAPVDPTVATAAAYALYLQGGFNQALSILGGLPEAELQSPERAAYVGPLLAAAGPIDQAEASLKVALSQPSILNEQRSGLRRCFDLVTYRRTIENLLHPSKREDGERARTLFINRAQAGTPVFLLGESVALESTPDAAAKALAQVQPASLNQAELCIYVGGVLALTSRLESAAPYLELAHDLPIETKAERLERALGLWWNLYARGPDNTDVARGLLATYRALDPEITSSAYWQHDMSRESKLTSDLLRRGLLAAEVQERLESLGRHVSSTPEMEIQIAYAYFLQGRAGASWLRLELVPAGTLHRPEFECFVSPILESARDGTRPHLLVQRAPSAEFARSGKPPL